MNRIYVHPSGTYEVWYPEEWTLLEIEDRVVIGLELSGNTLEIRAFSSSDSQIQADAMAICRKYLDSLSLVDSEPRGDQASPDSALLAEDPDAPALWFRH